jgi:hydroxypyruvate isomerase
MPKFSANISTLFRELPLIERIGAAADVGFEAIEIQFPYDEDPIALKTEIDQYGLKLALMNFPAGDLMTGGEGLAAIPDREMEFELALNSARQFAEVLKPRAINLLAGKPGTQHSSVECEAVFKRNLHRAGLLTRELGIQLLTEPVNTIDLPGFFLSGSQQTLDLIESLPEIELQMQYDLYHMQIMESDLITRLPEVIHQVGHIQFSDVPNRTEPGLGSIDFDEMFNLIDSLDYDGYVGAEYFPTIETSRSFEWFNRYRQLLK